MTKISFITFTRNSAHRLKELLEHIKDIVDEIIVVDGYSTDETVDVARSYGAKVYERKPWGYPDPDRMFALKQASYNWILMLDDDERLCNKLRIDLRDIIDKCSIEDFVAIDLLRMNLSKYNRIILAPYFPDRVLKIFRKDRVIFTGRVHNGPKVFGKTYHLPEKYYLIHLPYHEDGWLKKMITYAYFQCIQYDCITGGNKLRQAFIHSLPFTAIPYYLYLLSTFVMKKVPINALSLKYTWRRAFYDSVLQILMKTRSDMRRRIAKEVSEVGFSQLLKL
jgi:(heptosyl)LPS beta-1,4-glucosyltransferase